MRKVVLMVSLIGLVWLASANLQIQTNLENAVQTIKKIFITSDWLAANGSNNLISLNADGSGKLYVKNTFESSGPVILNGLPTDNSPTNYKVLTLWSDNNIYKTDPTLFTSTWWTTSSGQWLEGPTTLQTNKIVWIGTIGLNHQFWVAWNSIFQSGWNYIYLFPGNQFNSSYGGITNDNNNLKINTKSSWTLYLNYDVSNADTVIANNNKANATFKADGNVGIDITMPTSRLDISNASAPYNQLRIRNSYTPTSTSDSNGSAWDIVRDANYIYIKTADWRKRTALETFGPGL